MAKKINRIDFLNVYTTLVGIKECPKQDIHSGNNIYYWELEKSSQVEFIPASNKYVYTIYIKQDFEMGKDVFDKLVNYIDSLNLGRTICLDCCDIRVLI